MEELRLAFQQSGITPWGAKISYFSYVESPDVGMVNKQIHRVSGVLQGEETNEEIGRRSWVPPWWGDSEKELEPHWVGGLICALHSKFFLFFH